MRKKPLDVQGAINSAAPYSAKFSVQPKNQSMLPTQNQSKPMTFSQGATAPNPTVITPPKGNSTLNTPAAQQYMQTQGGSMASQLESAKQQAGQISEGIKTMTPAPTAKKDSAYIEYLKTLFNPQSAKLAMDEKNAAAKNLSDVNMEIIKQQTESRRRYDNTLDTAGGLKTGTQAGATVDRRRSNAELADLSLRRMDALGASEYASDIVQQYLDAGATIEEAEKAASAESEKVLTLEEATTLGVPYGTTVGEARLKGIIPQTADEAFTLSEGQARYDSQGNLIASKGKTYAPGTGGVGSAYVPGANPAVDSWVKIIQSGKGTISSVPANIKNAVAQALSSATPAKSQTATEIDTLIDSLLTRNTDAITGVPDPRSFLPGSDGQLTRNMYNQLKGLMSLDKRTLLKGSGAISDYEFKVLEQAASSLGKNLSNEDFRFVLADIKNKLNAGAAPASGDMGGQPQQMELNGQILTLQADGTYE